MKLFIKNSQARKYYPEKKYFSFKSNFSKKGLLHLLYGVKRKNKYYAMRAIKGDEAYDNYHFMVRSKEVVFMRQLKNLKKILFKHIPRPEKFFFLYCLLASNKSKKTNILELGSSVMEMIDGVKIFEKIFKKNLNVKYFGIEHSKLLSSMSNIINKEAKLYKNYKSFLKNNSKETIAKMSLHDIAVTSYIFKNTDDLIKNLNMFSCGYIKIYLSKGKEYVSFPQGRRLVHFSIPQIRKKLKHKFYILFTTKEIKGTSFSYLDKLSNLNIKDLVHAFCYFGPITQFKKNLINFRKKDKSIDSYLKKINFNYHCIN